QTIVDRHESLRTRFIDVDGQPVQIIEPQLKIELPLEDLSQLDEVEQRRQVAAAVQREEQEPFDLRSGPVLRVKLLKISEQEHILLETFHHIVSDGWSQGIFNGELKVLYEAYREGGENPLEPLGVQYADFTLWQRDWLDQGALDAGLQYWRERLAGIPDRLELPTDRPRPEVQTFAAQVHSIKLDAERLAELKQLSKEHQSSLYMTLLSCFGVLLGRYSGQDDIVVGSPIANRQEAQLEDLIGFFVNSLVMRVKLNGEQSFSELLGEVRRTTLEAYQHQDIPFERLVEELAPERSLNTTPIFQVMFALQNAPTGTEQLKGLEIEPLVKEQLQVRFDLEVYAVEAEGEMWIWWIYNLDLFDDWRIRQMASHYERLLAAVVAAPQEPLHRLEMLSAQERQILLEANNPRSSGVAETSVAELFELQGQQSPDALAVIFGQQRLGYSELNERANQLARHLIGLGVGPETLVGVALDRSVEMVVALLGIVKAGGAYLPLATNLPALRRSSLVRDAGLQHIITGHEHQSLFAELIPAVVTLDGEATQWSAYSTENPGHYPAPSGAVYVNYT